MTMSTKQYRLIDDQVAALLAQTPTCRSMTSPARCAAVWIRLRGGIRAQMGPTARVGV
jgi:hypothetical protein